MRVWHCSEFLRARLAASHGLGKLPPSEQFVAGVTNLEFSAPVFFAWATSLGEFPGGAFLALGLFTRISSFFIACTMLTAALGTHSSAPFQKKEFALLSFHRFLLSAERHGRLKP